MRTCEFETVDVFTTRRFGGNQLAVFPDASGLSDAEMQQLAAEFNLSETTFVLPPADAAHTARVRIFNRSHEMPFAGHPMVGTAYVLAARLADGREHLAFEVPAGVVDVQLRYDNDHVSGAEIEAPQPLSTGVQLAAADVAASAGLAALDIRTALHPPLLATVGNTYVIAEVDPHRLDAATPDLAAFRRVLGATPGLDGRYSLYLYAHTAPGVVAARMFAPLAGTYEDPATGSAATPLAALLLSLTSEDRASVEIHQGVKMGRPSVLYATAWRAGAGIHAAVAGSCVPVLRGTAQLS